MRLKIRRLTVCITLPEDFVNTSIKPVQVVQVQHLKGNLGDFFEPKKSWYIVWLIFWYWWYKAKKINKLKIIAHKIDKNKWRKQVPDLLVQRFLKRRKVGLEHIAQANVKRTMALNTNTLAYILGWTQFYLVWILTYVIIKDITSWLKGCTSSFRITNAYWKKPKELMRYRMFKNE